MSAFRVSFTPYLSQTRAVLNLIAAYKRERPLWDYDHVEYKNSMAKEEAWNRIATETGIPADICRRKMHSLQSQLRREKCKEREYRINGRPNWRSKWYAYQAFKFLNNRTRRTVTSSTAKNNCEPVATAVTVIKEEKDHEEYNEKEAVPSNDDDDDDHNQQQYTIENVTMEMDNSIGKDPISIALDMSQQQQQQQHQSSSKKVTNQEQVAEMNKYSDEIRVYAETISHRLRRIKDRRTLCVVRNKIDNLLFEAEMEMYDKEQHRVHVLTDAYQFSTDMTS